MRTCSRAFTALVATGLVVEGTAGWLVYIWSARVLPCRFSPAQAVLGRSSVCPVPVTFFGHNSFVPVFALAALLLASIVLFVVSFARIAVATLLTRRACVHHRIVGPTVLTSVTSAKWLVVVDDLAPTAYCIGLVRPWVVVTSGLLERLTEPSLRAVLAHETSHRRRRDPFRSAVATSVARGLFFVPSLRDLAVATLAENEISADAKAIGLFGRENLVTGLLAVLGHPAPAGSAAIATHGLLQLRLDALESGRRPVVHLRTVRLAASAVLIAVLLATAAWLPRYPRAHIVQSAPPSGLHAPSSE
jgi:Zn-dependent protease with chaperone function